MYRLYAAAAVAALSPCKLQANNRGALQTTGKNRLPVKGEIYKGVFVICLNALTKRESRDLQNREITGARTGS